MTTTPSWPIRALHFIKAVLFGLWSRFLSLRPIGKVAVCVAIAILAAESAAFIIITPKVVFQYLYNWAHGLAEMQLGWLILAGVVAFVCFPPLPGHSTVTSLCGFAYGLKGFLIAAPASLIGSSLVFIIFRLLFSRRLKKWASSNERWQALETVIKTKGLPLIILIRASPFPPWTYNSALFASIEPVKFWQFFLATFFVFPKILLHVFIGSQAAALSDGDRRSKMTKWTYIINITAIIASVMVAICASWLTYREMQKQIKALEHSSDRVSVLAGEALEEAEEGAPLLRSFSSESLDRADAA